MKRNSMLVIGLFALTTLVGATALAGATWGSPVYINTTTRVAYGTMGTVRASADNTQSIGCAVRANVPANSLSVACYATDATGVSVQCNTTNPMIVQAATAMVSNSHLQFKWDTSGACTFLAVENYSTNAPIEP